MTCYLFRCFPHPEENTFPADSAPMVQWMRLDSMNMTTIARICHYAPVSTHQIAALNLFSHKIPHSVWFMASGTDGADLYHFETEIIE